MHLASEGRGVKRLLSSLTRPLPTTSNPQQDHWARMIVAWVPSGWSNRLVVAVTPFCVGVHLPQSSLAVDRPSAICCRREGLSKLPERDLLMLPLETSSYLHSTWIWTTVGIFYPHFVVYMGSWQLQSPMWPYWFHQACTNFGRIHKSLHKTECW